MKSPEMNLRPAKRSPLKRAGLRVIPAKAGIQRAICHECSTRSDRSGMTKDGGGASLPRAFGGSPARHMHGCPARSEHASRVMTLVERCHSEGACFCD